MAKQITENVKILTNLAFYWHIFLVHFSDFCTGMIFSRKIYLSIHFSVS